MEQSGTSIFDLICEKIEDGALPEDFRLPEPENTLGGLHWAPGAMDGVGIYHMSQPKFTDGDRADILAALRAVSDGSFDAAYDMFRALGEKHSVLRMIDVLQGCVYDHLSELNQNNLYRFAFDTMLLKGRDISCVKVGLELTELFASLPPELRDIIRTLGACDEFTIFAVYNMKKWPDANDEIFRLAQKVHGWGRVHAVDNLEPETPEIRGWLLREGWKNGVMAAYSALTCWERSGAEERLRGPLSAEDLTAVGCLLEAMLDEGPAPGISALRDAPGVVGAYLAQAARAGRRLSIRDYETIFELKEYVEAKWGDEALAGECADLLDTDACRKAVRAALEDGRCVELARALGVPYRKTILAAMRRDIDRHYGLCRFLVDEPESAEAMLAVFRERFPPNAIEQEPRNDLGFDPSFARYHKLDFLLQELRETPLLGADYVAPALLAPPTRCRHMAVRALTAWTAQTRTPLAELSPPLWRNVRAALDREPCEDLREKLQALLDGVLPEPVQEEESGDAE